MPPTIVDLTASSPVATSESEETPVKVSLKTAIVNAQPERVRATLQEICNASPEAFQIAQNLLLVPEEHVKHKTINRSNRIEDDTDQDEDEDEQDDNESSDDEDDSEGSDDASREDGGDDEENGEDHPRIFPNGSTVIQTNGVKRLRSKFATCTHCSEEFDVADNGKDSCVWHPGGREADYRADIWADHDEDCHGRISDLEDDFPESFIYSCCKRVGTAEGCRIGRHVEKEKRYKRARY